MGVMGTKYQFVLFAFANLILPIRLLDDSLLIEPLEHSTSSENDTLEFLDCLLDEFDDDDDEEEDTEDLSDLTGTTTGDSDEQFSQLATLSLAPRGTLPSSLQKLSLASRLWPCSRSKYCKLFVNNSRYSGGGLR